MRSFFVYFLVATWIPLAGFAGFLLAILFLHWIGP